MDMTNLHTAPAPSRVPRATAPDGASTPTIAGQVDPARIVEMLEDLALRWAAVSEQLSEADVRGSGALSNHIPHELNSSLVYWRRRQQSTNPDNRAVVRLKWTAPAIDVLGDRGIWCYGIHIDGVRVIGGISRGPDLERAKTRAESAAVQAGILNWHFEL